MSILRCVAKMFELGIRDEESYSKYCLSTEDIAGPSEYGVSCCICGKSVVSKVDYHVSHLLYRFHLGDNMFIGCDESMGVPTGRCMEYALNAMMDVKYCVSAIVTIYSSIGDSGSLLSCLPREIVLEVCELVAGIKRSHYIQASQ